MRNHFRLVVSLLLAPFLVLSCVTEYQPDTITIPPSLVVDGLITDQPGPYTVKLTRTADYTVRSLNLLETGATVVVSDNAGNQERLVESTGIYSTKTIQGVAGRTYKLTIKTKDGKVYESDPEVLKAAPPIGKIYYEYRKDPEAITNDKINGWDLYIDTKDAETTGDFYRWDWVHYEPIDVCRKTYVMATPPYYVGAACCTECWDIVRCYNCINITSDVNINGKSISRQLIERVPYTSGGRYYVEVKQQLISRGVYEFLKTVKQLTQSTGGLFDPAPASVSGNMRCTTDAATKVYGYFGAAGESVASIRVDRSNGIGAPVGSGDVVVVPQPSACAVCDNNTIRTPIKPRFWVY